MKFFKQKDFQSLMMTADGARDVANQANALLEAEAVRVYHRNGYGWWYADKSKGILETHQAFLVCIEELPKKECEHELLNGVVWDSIEDFHYGICKHCRIKIKPTGWEIG